MTLTNGSANNALVKMIAKAVGVVPTHVEVVAGRKSRVNTLKLNGDGDQIAENLEDLPN